MAIAYSTVCPAGLSFGLPTSTPTASAARLASTCAGSMPPGRAASVLRMLSGPPARYSDQSSFFATQSPAAPASAPASRSRPTPPAVYRPILCSPCSSFQQPGAEPAVPGGAGYGGDGTAGSGAGGAGGGGPGSELTV